MRITFSNATPLLKATFGDAAVSDNVLDEQELSASGLDDKTLKELGYSKAATLDKNALARVVGAAVQRKHGLPIAKTQSERQLNADIMQALEWLAGDQLSEAEIVDAAKTLLALPLEQRRRAYTLLHRDFSDDATRRYWLMGHDTYQGAIAIICELSTVVGFKPSAYLFFGRSMPSDPQMSAQLLKSLIPSFGNDEARYSLAEDSARQLAAEGVTDPKALRDGVLLCDRFLTRDTHSLGYLTHAGLKLSTLTKDNFVAEVAKAIAAHLAHDPSWGPVESVRIVNGVHDLQGQAPVAGSGGDSHREGIIKALGDREILAMMAGDRGEMYNSTYRKLYAECVRRAPEGDVGAWLRTQDPTLMRGLLASFARFRQLDAVMQGGDLFVDMLITGASGSDAPRLAPVLSEMLVKGTPEVREKLRKALFDLLDLDVGAPGRATAGLALRAAYDRGASFGEDYDLYGKRLPAIPKATVPVDGMLADGAVTTVQFLTTNQGGADPKGMANYYIAHGFVETTVARKVGRVVEKDLGNGVMISMVESVDVPAAKVPFGLNPKQTKVFEKVVNGVTLRMVITTDMTRDRKAVIDDPGVDMVTHRGHLYDFDKTFPAIDNPTRSKRRKFLFGGSCSSYSDMTSEGFQRSYGEHLLFSDSDTGQAAVNNPFILDVMKGVAAGKRQISSYGLERYVDKHGIVLADAPEMQLEAYAYTLRDFVLDPSKNR